MRGKDEQQQRKALKLRDRAARALGKGHYRKALDCYLTLGQMEGAEASWSKRAADCYRSLGRRQEEKSAL